MCAGAFDTKYTEQEMEKSYESHDKHILAHPCLGG